MISLFQFDVGDWMLRCFGREISEDKVERADRFGEEALELLQSVGMDKERVLRLVNYVYDRPEGDPRQEVGGVMVTLAAFCRAHGINLEKAAMAELKRICQPAVMEKIRAKQKAKPSMDSPLPQ